MARRIDSDSPSTAIIHDNGRQRDTRHWIDRDDHQRASIFRLKSAIAKHCLTSRQKRGVKEGIARLPQLPFMNGLEAGYHLLDPFVPHLKGLDEAGLGSQNLPWRPNIPHRFFGLPSFAKAIGIR